jgi:protein involved in polysaccharide export with SLBB domain
MKLVRLFTRVFAVVGFALLIGCATGGGGQGRSAAEMINDRSINTEYRPGDKITIDFLDNPSMPQNWQQTVREDGMITLPLNQTVLAAGKRKGDLEKEIHALYVPKLLRRLTVNLRAEERTYFVRGEVKSPGQRPHTGSITALKAVGAAGDFTDFANRRKIEVIRANGEKLTVNGREALKDPSKDVPVYPGDIVYVHRRYF